MQVCMRNHQLGILNLNGFEIFYQVIHVNNNIPIYKWT